MLSSIHDKVWQTRDKSLKTGVEEKCWIDIGGKIEKGIEEQN